jgi:hypothetical protein
MQGNTGFRRFQKAMKSDNDLTLLILKAPLGYCMMI